MPNKIVLIRIILDSRRDLDGRDFLPQFMRKGKARIVAQKAKQLEKGQFQKNDVRVMPKIRPSETVQLSPFLENPENRHVTEVDCDECEAQQARTRQHIVGQGL